MDSGHSVVTRFALLFLPLKYCRFYCLYQVWSPSSILKIQKSAVIMWKCWDTADRDPITEPENLALVVLYAAPGGFVCFLFCFSRHPQRELNRRRGRVAVDLSRLDGAGCVRATVRRPSPPRRAPRRHLDIWESCRTLSCKLFVRIGFSPTNRLDLLRHAWLSFFFHLFNYFPPPRKASRLTQVLIAFNYPGI